jgi:membrane protein implicated in regulation of membrane protease activity
MAEILGLTLPLLLLLAGTVTMLAEAVIPGGQFVVVGVGMFLAGLVGVLAGGPFSSIVVLTVMTIAFALFAYAAFREMDLYNGPDRGQTSDSDDLTGETAIVTERVTNQGGSVELMQGGGFDPNYRARSTYGEIEEGEKVIVTDPGGGSIVQVEPLDVIQQDSIDRELARGRETDANDPADATPSTDGGDFGTTSASDDDQYDRETESEHT